MQNNKNNNSNTDWSKRDIGALWKREGQNQKYLSGYIKVDELGIEKEVKVVVFSNKNKNNNDKAPDYRIYISKPLQKEDGVKNKTTSSETKKVAQKTKVLNEVQEESEEDSIL